jgi:Mn-dependent DtxR family transcriptional regulator
MNNNDEAFYTVRGYALLHQQGTSLTPSMEDYLEMIYRLTKEQGHTRISALAGALHVQLPSASRMVQRLAELGFVRYERYGVLALTAQGREVGAFLLRRHNIIEQFLRLIGVSENVLEETEKIEHNVGSNTLEQINILVEFLRQNRVSWLDFLNRHKGRPER